MVFKLYIKVCPKRVLESSHSAYLGPRGDHFEPTPSLCNKTTDLRLIHLLGWHTWKYFDKLLFFKVTTKTPEQLRIKQNPISYIGKRNLNLRHDVYHQAYVLQFRHLGAEQGR